LTQDAWFQYTYDAWNRLVKVTTRHDARTISTQAYDGTGRRIKKVVSNSGTRNGTEYYYYAGQQMIEIYEIF
jgi:YD repeat-containing protein